MTTFFFSFFEGIEDPTTTQRGPSLAHQQNAIEMASRWRADDDQTLNAGLVFLGIGTRIAQKPYIFVIFQGGGGGGGGGGGVGTPYLDLCMLHFF